MSDGLVTVFGGSGYLGRWIAQRLAQEGATVRAVCRRPDNVALAAGNGAGGEIVPLYADVRDETTVAAAVAGVDAVVNAVGLYVEHDAETFDAVHVQGALHVARTSARTGVDRLVHVSGIGVNEASSSPYLRARALGEAVVWDVFGEATILRPSAVFGPDDAFLSALNGIVRSLPVVPLFGRGDTRLQPVYVGDVAAAVAAVLDRPETRAGIYELGGPEVFRYRELIEMLSAQLQRRRILLPLPFWLWDLLARLAAILPSPPLTRDQVALMRRDNVVGGSMPNLNDLGVTPTAIRSVLAERARRTS